MLRTITLTFALALGALTATSQIAVHGTVAANTNQEWQGIKPAFGGGVSWQTGRVMILADLWTSKVADSEVTAIELPKGRPIIRNYSRTDLTAIGAFAYRVAPGVFVEAGAGAYSAKRTLIEGRNQWFDFTAPTVTFGGFYQFGNRIFARTGYRYYVVHGELNSQQVYTSIGVSW